MTKKPKPPEVAALAEGLTGGAWQTWTRLARSGVMETPGGRDVMLKRHEIVVRIIDVNSKSLRLENEINGLDIERRNAARDLGALETDANRNALAAIDERIAALDAQRQRLMAEKAWLEQTLDDFDIAARNDNPENKSARRTS